MGLNIKTYKKSSCVRGNDSGTRNLDKNRSDSDARRYGHDGVFAV